MSSDLPVTDILLAIQSYPSPDLEKLTEDQLYQIENSLKKSVELRLRPRYIPASIVPTDLRLELTFNEVIKDENGDPVLDEDGLEKYQKVTRKYFVRELDTGDALELASIGPQIIEEFFDGNQDTVSSMSYLQLAHEVVVRSISKRLSMAMTDLSEAIIHKACSLIMDIKTKEPLTFEKLQTVSNPKDSEDAIRKAIEGNALFFSYLGSRIPGNINGALRSLTGMISSVGNLIVENLQNNE